ncbi:MAG: hypothetical protein J6A16_03600 [Oscillospiraceae bacterium]|nr:hypothetical protein [Oscillospiraceae bacterium]
MKYILSAAAICAAAIILTEPSTVADAVGSAVYSCLDIIIPSLFAFTVLCVYLQSSGLYVTVLRPVTIPLSHLLKIDEELCAIIILSNIGGYPVGAKLLTSLVQEKRLSKDDAGRLLCCCYGSGPSFIICIVGARVFSSTAIGAVIFGACFISSMLIAVFICRRSKISLLRSDNSFDLSADVFIGSVTACAKVMFTVCAMITGFSVITAMLDISGVSQLISSLSGIVLMDKNSDVIFPALLEISRIKELLPLGVYTLPLSSALLSFGGVCVIMQISAITSGLIPMKHFLLSRIPAAALSALISFTGIFIPFGAVSASAAPAVQMQTFSVNAGMSLCVLIMCGMLLYTSRGRRCS